MIYRFAIAGEIVFDVTADSEEEAHKNAQIVALDLQGMFEFGGDFHVTVYPSTDVETIAFKSGPWEDR